VGEWEELIRQPANRVRAISVDLKGGNDSIDLDQARLGSSFVSVSVPAVLRGGLGRDVIRGGNGLNTIYGGTGPSAPVSVEARALGSSNFPRFMAAAESCFPAAFAPTWMPMAPISSSAGMGPI
jgi:hypothetical protein